MTHVIIHPTDGNTVLYCQEGSWRKRSHPHPILAPDDKYVILGSNAGGRRDVHVALVDWAACLKSDR